MKVNEIPNAWSATPTGPGAQFLERLDSMNEHKESLRNGIKFTPDERYPDLSREELIKHTILAICL